jgi:cell division septation protein DedD
MTTNRLRPMAFRFAIGAVLGAALLAGTAYGDARVKPVAQDGADQASRSEDKAVARAEEAVAKSPTNAALRSVLGQAYLRSGRFVSATDAFTDAMALGDGSARSVLGLALANIARGNNREALGILDHAQGGIPASDLGLALALAGESGRGVAVLTDALRGGENTAKVRQNLAYAYALDGHWAEAKIMMTQDVPGDQLNARLTQWAASGRPSLYQERVAALVGAPVRADSGQPANLALNGAPVTAQAAAEVPAPAAPTAELPAVEQAYAPPPAPAPAPQAETLQAFSTSSGSMLAAPVEAAPVTAPVNNSRSLAAFDEYARPTTSMLATHTAKPVPARITGHAQHFAVHSSEGGNHVVQLGSFSSEHNARRAWNLFVARNAELKSARMVITPAVVGGRNFWRVAAASYDNSSANGLCSNVKARGGACFAYATSGPRQNLLMARTETRSGNRLALAQR